MFRIPRQFPRVWTVQSPLQGRRGVASPAPLPFAFLSKGKRKWSLGRRPESYSRWQPLNLLGAPTCSEKLPIHNIKLGSTDLFNGWNTPFSDCLACALLNEKPKRMLLFAIVSVDAAREMSRKWHVGSQGNSARNPRPQGLFPSLKASQLVNGQLLLP